LDTVFKKNNSKEGRWEVFSNMKKARQRSQIDANFQSIPFNYIQPLAIPSEEAYQTHLPCHVDPSMIS
jgi:hypothetical protein